MVRYYFQSATAIYPREGQRSCVQDFVVEKQEIKGTSHGKMGEVLAECVKDVE